MAFGLKTLTVPSTIPPARRPWGWAVGSLPTPHASAWNRSGSCTAPNDGISPEPEPRSSEKSSRVLEASKESEMAPATVPAATREAVSLVGPHATVAPRLMYDTRDFTIAAQARAQCACAMQDRLPALAVTRGLQTRGLSVGFSRGGRCVQEQASFAVPLCLVLPVETSANIRFTT